MVIGFRVWSDYWKKYATEAELYMDGSVDAIFEELPDSHPEDIISHQINRLLEASGKEKES